MTPGSEEAARSIVLVGMMGSGKSAVGAALARRLGRQLVDVDRLIEAEAGRSVPAIFAEEGEIGFRARESAAIRRACASPGAVIATGGGAVLDSANVEVLRQAGTVVWLEVTPEVAAQRVRHPQGRPVLQGMSGDLAERLAALCAERSAAYRRAAHVTVKADGPVNDAVAAILEGIRVEETPVEEIQA